MTAQHVQKLRALPQMTDEEAQAAFQQDKNQAMVACWPVLIDECCRLQQELDSTDHIKLDALMEENEGLREQVQELTDQLGALTNPQ
jgi:hypothetical protein